ncbi:MAG: ABC transporter substrate-binding protein [Pseudomonadota bacterium]
MKRNGIIALIVAVLFGLGLFVSCGKKEEAKPVAQKAVEKAKVYKLALSLAQSGPTSDAGQPYAMGVEDFFKFVNDEKLLGEDKIECTIRDDQYKTDVTKRNFEEFLNMGIVLYLNYSTGSTMALKKDFDETKIATIPASFHKGNLDGSTYIFLPIASYSEQAIALAEYIANNNPGGGKAKVAMYIHPSAFGRGPVEDVQKAIEAGLPIEVVEVVEHGKDLDSTATLQRLASKGVQYVISQTVQSPVATFLKDAERLNLVASEFGEKDKITFMGCHYTGGTDLIALAGPAANNFFWTTSYTLTSEPGPGADAQIALAKRYGRDDKTANSHNYTNGVMVAQVAFETIRRAKAAGQTINRENLYKQLLAMNGIDAFYPVTTVGPVTYSETDKAGVDTLQIYRVQDGVFKAVGLPVQSVYMKKIK